MSNLFANEDEMEVLKRELTKLTAKEYIETVEDTRFPKISRLVFVSGTVVTLKNFFAINKMLLMFYRLRLRWPQ